MVADAPGEKRDLVPLARALLLVLKVIHRPAGLGLREVREEFVVVVRLGLLRDDDLLVVRAEREDDVLDLLPELQLLVGLQALGVHADAGLGLWRGTRSRR